jgi:hypothetical protein
MQRRRVASFARAVWAGAVSAIIGRANSPEEILAKAWLNDRDAEIISKAETVALFWTAAETEAAAAGLLYGITQWSRQPASSLRDARAPRQAHCRGR